MRLLVTPLLGLAACVGPTYVYESVTTTRIVGADATTTLQVDASWDEGGHGAAVSHPRSGLTVLGGPAPGALMPLVEAEPGRYTASLAGAAPAFRYRFEDTDFVHDAPQLTAAAVTAGPERTATVTWDPPVDRNLGDDAIQISLIAPSGRPTGYACGSGAALIADDGDRLELAPCALPESGRYLVTVRRERVSLGDDDDHDFLYASAAVAVERVLTLDVP